MSVPVRVPVRVPVSVPATGQSTTGSSPDLRTVLLAAAAWAGALGGLFSPGPGLVALAAGVLAWLAARFRGRCHGAPALLGAGCLLVAAATGGSVWARAQALADGPVAELAERRTAVTATLRVTTDPRLRSGRFADYVLLRATTHEVAGSGGRHRARVPVLVLAGPDWQEVELGALVRLTGRAQPADGKDLAAVLTTSRRPALVRPPPEVLDGAARVRAAIRAAVAGAGPAERTLVPALVVGDDQGMPADVVEEFRTSGLTHLLAVSGTNLTLIVGFLLVVARWGGVRARGLLVIGALGVAGFVLLARTEPSVVRAAAMGSVALLGMGSNGRQKGLRALGMAVLVLLLANPWLAVSMGFVLSALATAGILLLAPPWRDQLCRWLPRWMAEAVSVPLAAQLACTPAVAALSDQVSLVAVGANMVAAPVVGPATVLGLLAGVLVLLVEPAGLLVGRAAAGCAAWIVAVADHAAGLPTAAVEWTATAGSLVLLSSLCLLLVLVLPPVLAHPALAIPSVVLLVAAVLVRPPSPGWPPAGWVLVACDVGQGDGLVLRAGPGAAVVVDAGRDPPLIDRCLDRLDIEAVPLVVLTHFHEDHVGGLSGVLDGRAVGRVLVTGLPDPPSGVAAVAEVTSAVGVPVRVPRFGEVRRTGAVTWQVLGPVPGAGAAGEGSAANNASVVLLAVVDGVRVLLTGDVEPEAQRALARVVGDLEVDVLKVPHHGSRYQDPAFLAGLGARLALVSAGEDNEYGHPSPSTLRLLEEAGAVVRRTDLDGDVAVVVDEQGRLGVAVGG